MVLRTWENHWMKERRDSPRTLLDSVEVGLVAWPSVSALEVGRELAAQLWPGVEGSLGQVHEPGPGRPGQGNGEVVGHNGFIPPAARIEVE
jgi:hypothetical protein